MEHTKAHLSTYHFIIITSSVLYTIATALFGCMQSHILQLMTDDNLKNSVITDNLTAVYVSVMLSPFYTMFDSCASSATKSAW